MPIAKLPPEIDRDVRVLPLPLPDAEALAAVLDAELARTDGTRDAFVRAALGLTLDEARRAFRVARSLPDSDEALSRVIAEKRGALRRSACLELVDADVTLGDVGGLDVLKYWLRSRVLAFDAGARAFGLAEPRGMLVCGVQGCGKSLVSKATARVLSLPLVRLDFAEVPESLTTVVVVGATTARFGVAFHDVDVSVLLFRPSTDTDFDAVIVTSMFRYDGLPTPAACALPARPTTAKRAAPNHFIVFFIFMNRSQSGNGPL